MREDVYDTLGRLSEKGVESINLNIWDDFYDDDYVPEGKEQKTYAYIEDSDISEDDQEILMDAFHKYLLTNFKEELAGVTIGYGGDRIYFTHLTHNKLDSILKKLDGVELTFGGIPYNIYSES